MPIALDGIRTCISGIRAHSASDCTTTAGTPPVSRNKHFRHSPVSSIVKQSCMKHSNSYLRDRDAKHLQGPPLSRTRRVRERRKIELTVCVCLCVRERERAREREREIERQTDRQKRQLIFYTCANPPSQSRLQPSPWLDARIWSVRRLTRRGAEQDGQSLVMTRIQTVQLYDNVKNI